MELKRKKVHVVSTGGTIEKNYDERKGALGNHGSVIKEIIETQLRLPYLELCFHEFMAKDSLDLTEEDRNKILRSVLMIASFGEPIVILHGTDTIQETIKFFEESGKRFAVPVVFTGAMRPIGFHKSDALQNLTEALLVCQMIEPGLYLSFHGKLMSGSNFRKNHDLGTFVEN